MAGSTKGTTDMKLRDALTHVDWQGGVIGFPVFAVCSRFKVGLVLYEEDGIFRGLNIENGNSWQSRDPEVVPAEEVIRKLQSWPYIDSLLLQRKQFRDMVSLEESVGDTAPEGDL